MPAEAVVTPPAAAAPAAAAPSSTPAAGSPPASPASSAPPGGGDSGGGGFDDLDKQLESGLDAKFGKADDGKPPVSDKGGDGKGEPKAGDKPSEKAGDKGGKPAEAKAGDKPGEKPGEKPAAGGPKELRAELDRVKAENKAALDRVAEYERKIAEAEAKGRDTTALAEKLAAAEKKQAEMQAELRAAKREFSDEFKAKHEAPFNAAAEYAKRDIEQLLVTESNPETGEETQREAKWDDFVALYRLPKGRAIAAAKGMFGGEQLGVVISHLTELQRLDWQKTQAAEAEKSGWEAKDKEVAARAAQEREAVSDMWTKVNADLREKKPELFGDDPEDEEGNAILKKGYELVDTALHNRAAMTTQQRVVVDANIRNRAAAFSRERHRSRRLTAEMTELRAKLAEYESSKPSRTAKPGGKDVITPPADGDGLTGLGNDLRQAVEGA